MKILKFLKSSPKLQSDLKNNGSFIPSCFGFKTSLFMSGNVFRGNQVTISLQLTENNGFLHSGDLSVLNKTQPPS